MEYGYKVTTTGRGVITACWALQKPLNLTRVTVGSGRVAEDVDLADVHALLNPVADGAIGNWSHGEDRLNFIAQYENISHPEIEDVFHLSEFIVWAEHPETGEEVDFLYATLGDYIQSVPPYRATQPTSIFKFPVTVIVSNEMEVNVSAPAGLITADDLEDALGRHANNVGSAIIRQITVPATGWVKVGADAEGLGDYKYTIDVSVEEAKEMHFPVLALDIPSLSVAGEAEVCPTIETLDGVVRFWSKAVPADDLTGTILLRSENLVDLDVATDEEVDDTVDDIFGDTESGGSGDLPSGIEIATDEEVQDVLTDIFGKSR